MNEEMVKRFFLQFSQTSLFLYLHVLGPGYDLLEASFSEGDFRSFSKRSTKTATTTSVPVLTSVAEEPCADVSAIDSGQAAGLYSCPQEGCVRIFQRLSALERHLFSGEMYTIFGETFRYGLSQNGL